MPVDLQDILGRLGAGTPLDEAQAEGVFSMLFDGLLDEARIDSLLSLMAARPPSVDELVGAGRAMRRRATPVQPPPGVALVDTCGTGGAPKTFNVSTIAAIVVAAAAPGAVAVAKHGNRSRTGRGSAEVLEALGVNIAAGATVQARCLREIGVCFCYAPAHHAATRHAAGARKRLGVPTIFNILGPITNPAGAKRQLVGTPSVQAARVIAEALVRLGSDRALVVHSEDGLDELSTTAVNRTFLVENAAVREGVFDASSIGLPRAEISSLWVATLDKAVRAFREVLGGQAGPRTDMVLLNAGAALMVGGAAPTIEAGVARAGDAIGSGAAQRTLAGLVRLSLESPEGARIGR